MVDEDAHQRLSCAHVVQKIVVEEKPCRFQLMVVVETSVGAESNLLESEVVIAKEQQMDAADSEQVQCPVPT